MWRWLATAVVVLAAVMYPVVVDACSMPAGWRPPTMAELVEGARDVLFARVRRTFRDRPGVDTLYTAEVEVYCIMKGRRTPPILNITRVGTGFL